MLKKLKTALNVCILLPIMHFCVHSKEIMEQVAEVFITRELAREYNLYDACVTKQFGHITDRRKDRIT